MVRQHSKVVALSLREASLKRKIRRHLKSLGFEKRADGKLHPPDLSKDTYRALHRHQRAKKLVRNAAFLREKLERLSRFFADGHEVRPLRIQPRIELVAPDTLGGDLFRLASLYWQVPVSEGYGRRMRFLVWDDAVGKVIGIFALGDAVFNLKARDDFVGWDHHDRAERLVNLMDAYVLGAVPPYNQLLGGKMIACLVRTQEVAELFRERYKDARGIISGKKKQAHLVAVTTSSALGRSSIYNRLKLDGVEYFKSLGYTSGWGHFHFPDALFDELRDYLKTRGDIYSSNFLFGEGPNWRMRAIRKALALLGLDQDLTQHGLVREVFWASISDDAIAVLTGKSASPSYANIKTVAQVGEMAVARWLEPRGISRPEFLAHQATDFLRDIVGRNEALIQRAELARAIR